jgi:hypothetical protein
MGISRRKSRGYPRAAPEIADSQGKPAECPGNGPWLTAGCHSGQRSAQNQSKGQDISEIGAAPNASQFDGDSYPLTHHGP